jgi:predicted outer membrane protein
VIDAMLEFATPAPAAQQPAELTDAAIEAAWQTAHRPDGFDKRWFANAIIKAQGGSQ